jgi:FecR protein
MQDFFRRVAKRIIFGAAFLAICLLIGVTTPGTMPQPRAGETDSWTLAEVGGRVLVQTAGASNWTAASPGTSLPIGSSVRTGESGAAVLTMGGDRIQVMSSSEVNLAEPDPSAGILTHILQRVGTLFFKVAHRPSGTFRVDTPYLAVVVKGTEFGVSVSGEGASVSVSEGVVSVSRSEGGPASSVSAGQKASTGAEPGAAVSVESGSSSAAPVGPAAATTTAEAASAAVDSAGATGGSSSGGSSSGGSSSSGDSSGSDSSSGASSGDSSSGDTTGGLGGALGGIGDAVGGALGGLGDAVGGALGGLGGALGGLGGHHK